MIMAAGQPPTLEDTLRQVPYDLEIELRHKLGTGTFTDLAGRLLEDGEANRIRLDDFELVTNVVFNAADDGLPEPVDLRALMSSDPPEQEFLIEPFILARKHTGLVSKRGEGKSLVALDISARRSIGQAVLDQPAGDPIHVVYIDQEMASDDLWDRLDAFGWTVDNPDFDKLVEHFHYYQLIDLPPLDTEEGGIALEEIVDLHDATLVVIDTVIRVIAGGESDNDTFKDLFRHTETRLKRKGVTLLRLDHLGKDEKKGSRGASAKEDALDVVYQLKANDKGDIRLTKTKGRQDGLPEVVKIEQEYNNGVLRHVVPISFITEETMDLVFVIDQLNLPDDASTRTVQKALQAKDDGRRRADIGKAVTFRKGRKRGVSNVGTTPGTTSREPPGEPPGTTTEETTDDQGKRGGNHLGNHPEPSYGNGSPPYRGNHPDQTNTESLFDDPDDEANYGDPAL